jgi:magnesium-transporting ATPase (P-type)
VKTKVPLDAGVDLKIMSGDNPETVKALAVQAGFDPETKLISEPDLDRLDNGQLDTAAVEHGVIGVVNIPKITTCDDYTMGGSHHS